MTDLKQLEGDLLARIAEAEDEAALEQPCAIAALGKKGTISDLLKSLGGMDAGRAQDAKVR